MTKVPRRSSGAPAAITEASTKAKRLADEIVVIEAFRKNRALKATEAEAKKEHEKLRDDVILPGVKALGAPHGEKSQHLAIALDQPIGGKTHIVRRANKSTWLNVDRTDALVAELGIEKDVCQSTITVTYTGGIAYVEMLRRKLAADGDLAPFIEVSTKVDQEMLYAYQQTHRDKMPDKVLDGLFDTDVKYTLVAE